jgi:hypothetical protein
VRPAILAILGCVSLYVVLAPAQRGDSPAAATFEGAPAVVLANDKLELTITEIGASFAKLTLRDDPASTNPLWEPIRMGRELSGASQPMRSGSTGHFVCVDGFGPVSEAERAAGLPGHGEAHVQKYGVTARDGRSATLEAVLPIVQEKFTRTVRMAPGENVIVVESRLENLMGFDRPVNWAEHATVGSPFLESDATVVDVSGSRSQVRPWTQARMGAVERRLASGREFTWPMAPGVEGGAAVDLRVTPKGPHFLDHATTLVDTARTVGWTTALNTRTHLMIGWVFRRAEYPWVQYWGFYPPTGKMSRGLEFSTQPYDVSRREVMETHSLLGAPVYRWLPAKGTITTKFLMFMTRAPEGMVRVDDVRLENGTLVVEGGGRRITLAASEGL